MIRNIFTENNLVVTFQFTSKHIKQIKVHIRNMRTHVLITNKRDEILTAMCLQSCKSVTTRPLTKIVRNSIKITITP